MLPPMPAPAPHSEQSAWTLLLVVAVGGAIVAVSRFGVELGLAAAVADPLLVASLSLGAVNVLGAGGLGGLIGRLDRHGGPDWLRPFLGVGFFGAFTTFSGFVAHLRALHLEVGPGATAIFFASSCFAGAMLFQALRGAPLSDEADS